MAEPIPKKAEDDNAATLAKLLAAREELLNKGTSEKNHEGSFMELQNLNRQIELATSIVERDNLFRHTPTAENFEKFSKKLQDLNKKIRGLQTSAQPTF